MMPVKTLSLETDTVLTKETQITQFTITNYLGMPLMSFWKNNIEDYIMRTYTEESHILLSHDGFPSVDSMLDHLSQDYLCYDLEDEYVFDEYADIYSDDEEFD